MRLFQLKTIQFCSLFILIISLIRCTPEDITKKDEDIETVSVDPDDNNPEIEDEDDTDNITEDDTEEENDEIEDEDEDEDENENMDGDEDEDELTDAELVLALVNASRKEEGLSELVLNDALSQAALLHSIDMNTNNYFAHEGLDGSVFWERTAAVGYLGSPRGENIAKGQQTPEVVHTAWMNSEGHRANILNSAITEMGLGRDINTWTQIFGVGN